METLLNGWAMFAGTSKRRSFVKGRYLHGNDEWSGDHPSRRCWFVLSRRWTKLARLAEGLARPRCFGGCSHGRGCSGVEPALGRGRRSAATARRLAVRPDDAEL